MYLLADQAVMSFEFVWRVLTFCFVMSVVPGPNSTIVFSAGLNYGFLKTVPYMIGAAGSISLMFAAVAWGIMEIFNAFPAAYGYLRYVGMAYILYLAWKIAAAPVQEKNNPEGGSALGRCPTFLNGVLLQWVNPMIWMLAVAGVAICVVSSNPWLSLLILCVTFFVMCILGLMAWSYGGNLSGRFIRSSRVRRAVNLFMGLLLASSVWGLFWSL